MSENNGVVRIPRQGKIKFALGDDEPFEVDVIGVHDEWFQTDRSFRNEKDEVPADQQVAHAETRRAFFQGITAKAYAEQLPGKEVPVLTHAEAWHFLRNIQEESRKLLVFTVPASPGQPSSPEPSKVRFSM